MGALHTMRGRTAFLLYCAADIVCVGLGMGVPILCIMLGFVVGWVLVLREPVDAGNRSHSLNRIFRNGVISASVTFVLMAAIWGRCVLMLFEPAADYGNFGHPMILYEPKLSFIGWVSLMIIVSPFLQLLTTVFGAYLAFMMRIRQPSRDTT